jgi:hypothetical protein
VSSKPSVLAPVRERIRRFQFVVGLGFMSLIIGLCLITPALNHRLGPRLEDLPEALFPLVAIISVCIMHLWALAVLPLLCYGAARIIDLKPLSTAVGGVLTGSFFIAVLQAVSQGFEGLSDALGAVALHVSVLAAGVLISYRAVLKGRAAAAQGAAKAQAQAEARKVEYQEFLREAERGAEKSAQREAERTALVASAGGSPAPVASAAPAPEAPSPAAPVVPVSAAPEVSASPSPEPASPSGASPEASSEPKASTPP